MNTITNIIQIVFYCLMSMSALLNFFGKNRKIGLFYLLVSSWMVGTLMLTLYGYFYTLSEFIYGLLFLETTSFLIMMCLSSISLKDKGVLVLSFILLLIHTSSFYLFGGYVSTLYWIEN